MHGPNELFRTARLALPSRTKPGRPLTRDELAEMVNDEVWQATGRVVSLWSASIGRMERGQTRWPMPWTRTALRSIFGVDTDAELGFRRPLPKQLPPRRDDRPVDQPTGPAAMLVIGGRLVAVRVIATSGRTVGTVATTILRDRRHHLTAVGR